MTEPTKPLIAYVAGPNATIHFNPALVTGRKAREKHSLPPLRDATGAPLQFDALRPQRLARPAVVYVEQFSAHPLERDAADLYGPPDGFIDADGTFHRARQSADDTPVYEIELHPDDGLYPLPYMATRRDGSAWESNTTADAPGGAIRQQFYPDGRRVIEEIDRLTVDDAGRANALGAQARFAFHRVIPSGGYTQGNAAEGIARETSGKDFFAYRPPPVARHPPRSALATIANAFQALMDSGDYLGAIWTQGSPRIEETLYWLNLLLDTTRPVCGCAAQRGHGQLGDDGAKNIVDATAYLCSRVWADAAGADRVGAVLIQEQQIFASRDVQKGDARPGGYVTTGGHGGIVGATGHGATPVLTYLPVRKHTAASDVNIARLPAVVEGVAPGGSRIAVTRVAIKDDAGHLLPTAIPKVAIVKDGNFIGDDDDSDGQPDAETLFAIERNLRTAPLAGFVVEGLAPYGTPSSRARHVALEQAVASGMPVVCVGRGNNDGFAAPMHLFIGGGNLTATKARLLLMASLMRHGALPPCADPAHPSEAEVAALREALARYQAIFDTH